MSRRLGGAVTFFALLASMFAVGSVASAPAVLAYQGCNGTSSASASASSTDPNQPVDFTVTLKDCNGNGISGATVTFSQQAGPAGCTASFTPPQAVTDANGQATTVVTLPSGCPCQYTLAATGAGITVTTTVRENGCLPFTAAARSAAVAARAPSAPLLPLAVLALGLLCLGGAGLALARRRG